jgi:spore coat polysaccharide biosynthesis protein SpsF (cytidylyltransferase family)
MAIKNKKVGLIIQARMGSTRLPGKSNLQINGLTVLNWVINTAKSIEGVDRVILVTSNEKNCDCLEELANKENIFCIRGSENDVLSRYICAIKKYNLDYVIRITGDDICHDPLFIEDSMHDFFVQNCDYMISSTEKLPLIDGLIFEIFRSRLLIDIFKKGDLTSLDKEHVTLYIRNKKIDYKQGFINIENIPKIYINENYLKLCVDTYEDFRNLEESWSSKISKKNLKIANTEKIIINIKKKL